MDATWVKCPTLFEKATYFAVFITIVFLTSYYVYKGLEYSIRERLLKEIACDPGHGTVAGAVFSRDQIESETVDGGLLSRDEKIDTAMHRSLVEDLTPSAPPLFLPGVPPPPYDEVAGATTTTTTTRPFSWKQQGVHGNSTNYLPSGPICLEWYRVFDAFNEQRMTMAALWTPIPSGRTLERCLTTVGSFVGAQSHPVSEKEMLKFIKSFVSLTNLLYNEWMVKKRESSRVDTNDADDVTNECTRKDMFYGAFALLLAEYMPKTRITNKKVPYGYDWFVFTGRLTYAVINAHITTCALEPTALPYFCGGRGSTVVPPVVDTRTVITGLRNVCANFTDSLGFERYGSNRVYIGVAFLYASLLEKACSHLESVSSSSSPRGDYIFGDGATDSSLHAPDYTTTLNEILSDPENRYVEFKTLVDEIGKSQLLASAANSPPFTTVKRSVAVPVGAERGSVTYDGVYDDRSFFAHRRLRMYAYIRSYCEQLMSWQLLTRQRNLDDKKLAALLRAVEPMNGDGKLFYFNLHSRTGAFKYRNGSALFAAMGLREFAGGGGGTSFTSSSYGRVYVADKARILFVQSRAFTFHSIGQLTDLAYGEVERSNRDLMPAWLMGQRPIYCAERNRLADVPCGAHLEPCVIDTGRSEGLQLNLIRKRNTTDYTPTEALSAVVAFEEEGIGAVFSRVREINMDVCYSRCTVATPYYTFTTYFTITRNNGDDNKPINLSCYTGRADETAMHDSRDLFVFKHCTVRVFVQAKDGNPCAESDVTVKRQSGLLKRPGSKCKYESADLVNVSLSFPPYGDDASTNPNAHGSLTVLYTPRDDKRCPVPKHMLNHELIPRVTFVSDGVYELRIDSKFVIHCDSVRRVTILINILDRRACISAMCSTVSEEVTADELAQRASAALTGYQNLGKLNFESMGNRVYAYFA